MEDLELLRQQLYSAMNRGDPKEILRLSRKLDKIILKYLKQLDCKEVNGC